MTVKVVQNAPGPAPQTWLKPRIEPNAVRCYNKRRGPSLNNARRIELHTTGRAMSLKTLLIPALVVLGVAAVVSWAARSPVDQSVDGVLPADAAGDVAGVVERVDAFFQQRWSSEELMPAEPAGELTVLRRLSLCLHGTIPSLEEMRQFEADSSPSRLDRWTRRMLDDSRFHRYFAERLARVIVGTDEGQFIVFRRDRFVDWLSEQLAESRPYDEIVRQIISQQGLWTDRPATNFVTAAVANGELDENKLAGRSVRAFLGQRMDCAQCHDHPFDNWKQEDFEGLAAHFGQSNLSFVGVEDKPQMQGEPVEYIIEDRETLEDRTVPPRVPFGQQWLPETGTRREKLAAWITHPDNRRFERATANRIWGLMFGTPYFDPVDDLPDPGDPHEPELLDIVGSDFRESGCDLRRLIRVVAASRPFRLSSTHSSETAGDTARLAYYWCVFPLTRLRPEQVIGSMLQASSIKTIDQNSHLIVRAIRFIRENEFVQEYGDLGEDELESHSGTIPQALLRMNGELSQQTLGANLFTASGRIASLADSDRRCLETCYLVCLSRRPTTQERAHFLALLNGTSGDQRKQVVEDIFWSLFNSPEFAWNH